MKTTTYPSSTFNRRPAGNDCTTVNDSLQLVLLHRRFVTTNGDATHSEPGRVVTAVQCFFLNGFKPYTDRCLPIYERHARQGRVACTIRRLWGAWSRSATLIRKLVSMNKERGRVPTGPTRKINTVRLPR